LIPWLIIIGSMILRVLRHRSPPTKSKQTNDNDKLSIIAGTQLGSTTIFGYDDDD